MRLQSNELDSISKDAMQNFVDWILDVGDGKQCSDIEESSIYIEQNLILPKSHDDVQSIVDAIYPNLNSHIGGTSYLVSWAILTPTNEIVDDINHDISKNFTGEEIIYLSSYSIYKEDFNVQDQDLLYPTEFLNTLKFLDLPSHILRLKKGSVVMLMRNLNQGAGLCNGTRMKITQLEKWFVEGEVLSGSIIGDKVFIPRISLSPS
ncbi:uncharacterized protein [Cicer arietinum]|uniref:Uncharacterized protein LOC101491201 n=1 Tax=Cicer arietinum TaxID=3827 RepID=A0A1S2XPL9_CICAR|nr:uncharacterized protein LOC101491201 [Cicer arietinum]